MTDEQLLEKVEAQLAEERTLSHSILLGLLEIRKRRLYAKRGFSSLFEMLVKIWSHVEPDTVEVIRRSLKITLEKLEKKTQSATESVKHRSSGRLKYYGKGYDQALWERAGSRCEFVDETTGRRCECTKKLQREHVIPLAMGGTNELSNMQLLCRTHNLLRARSVFGDEKINPVSTAQLRTELTSFTWQSCSAGWIHP